jgi:hypothetical protein
MNGYPQMFDGHISLDRNRNQAIKNVFLLYNGISEQYHDLEILEKIRSMVPEHILQLNEDDKIKGLLGWFKNDCMRIHRQRSLVYYDIRDLHIVSVSIIGFRQTTVLTGKR